eukprot:m.419858 g.419858  ORF g.419858 m.419858 type:complete len:377 (+) comp31886_c0_seq1:159-1289(+)
MAQVDTPAPDDVLAVDAVDIGQTIADPEARIRHLERTHLLGIADDADRREVQRAYEAAVVELVGTETGRQERDGVAERDSAQAILHYLEELHRCKCQLLLQQYDRLKPLHDLDAILQSRDLTADDERLVRVGLNELCRFGVGDSELRNILGYATMDYAPNLTKVPGMMRRVMLAQFKHFEVRLHLFDDAAETYVHNHGMNFFSLCLTGGYHHTVWAVDHASEGSHYRAHREKGGGLSPTEPAAGGLKAVLSQSFKPGQLMFLDSSVYHTVSPLNDGSSNDGVATLTVRSRKRASAPSTILSRTKDIVGPTDAVEKIAHGDGLDMTFHTMLKALDVLEIGITKNCKQTFNDEGLAQSVSLTRTALDQAYDDDAAFDR